MLLLVLSSHVRTCDIMYIIFMLQSRPLQIYFRIHIGSRSQALVKFEIVKVGFNKEVDEHRATEEKEVS